MSKRLVHVKNNIINLTLDKITNLAKNTFRTKKRVIYIFRGTKPIQHCARQGVGKLDKIKLLVYKNSAKQVKKITDGTKLCSKIL